MTSIRRALCGAILALSVLVPVSHADLPPRTWVSGVGDDSNPCTRTAPCKTFAGALSKTTPDGVINAIDSGGFGAVTVTHGITIDGTGVQAGITASPVGVTINAPGEDVVLRDLSIDGVGTGPPNECSGTIAINLVAARSVRIEGVDVNHFATTGISDTSEFVPVGEPNTTLVIKDSSISNGCGAGKGITLTPAGSATVKAMLDGVTISNVTTGLTAANNAKAYLSDSNVFGNGIGLATSGSGSIVNNGGNQIDGNGDADVPPLSGATGATGAKGDTGATGSVGAQGPAGRKGAAGKVGKVTCKLRKHHRIRCKVKRAKRR